MKKDYIDYYELTYLQLLIESTRTDNECKQTIRKENPRSLFLLYRNYGKSCQCDCQNSQRQTLPDYPATAYTSADLDWNNKTSRSSIEMSDENSRPALGGEALNLKNYDVIFLGYPIWWNVCPRPINTFLEKYDFSGKAIIPFATSGSSSIANSVTLLKKLYPKIKWKEGRLCNDNIKQAEDWARQIIK